MRLDFAGTSENLVRLKIIEHGLVFRIDMGSSPQKLRGSDSFSRMAMPRDEPSPTFIYFIRDTAIRRIHAHTWRVAHKVSLPCAA